jgi:hypothetical protein
MAEALTLCSRDTFSIDEAWLSMPRRWSRTPPVQCHGRYRTERRRALQYLRMSSRHELNHVGTPVVARGPKRRNLGHQRAIAIGLGYLKATVPGKFLIVMDSDGQDRPEDVRRLLAAAGANPSPKVRCIPESGALSAARVRA